MQSELKQTHKIYVHVRTDTYILFLTILKILIFHISSGYEAAVIINIENKKNRVYSRILFYILRIRHPLLRDSCPIDARQR